MNAFDPELIPFLIRAKKATYAAGGAGAVASSRTSSHDLAFQDGEWAYLDTYLGGFAFIGEEAVWKAGTPMWGMNYYGTMTIAQIPEGFGDFLQMALRQPSPDAPYRGPARFDEGSYTYFCRWQGDPARFSGEESIALDGQEIYLLYFHGGIVTP
jgi:hypothetical protein